MSVEAWISSIDFAISSKLRVMLETASLAPDMLAEIVSVTLACSSTVPEMEMEISFTSPIT